jgi:hypothetical protein
MSSVSRIGICTTTVIVLAVSGCAVRMHPSVAPMTFPVVGSVSTRNVGENLITHGQAQQIPRLYIEDDTLIGETKILKGTYSYTAENTDRIKFMGGARPIYLYKKVGKICIEKSVCSDVKYSIEKVMGAAVANSFQRTLLYNGKIGEKITIGYREFSGDIARPAFSNEVSYDLSDSTIIGYKGARIEVVKATNTEITYKVLSGFIQ